ncbi:FAD-binding oxidoreductase [Stygiolobus caldivivus]|uniref:FAD-binding oxidoreductase n=1 Tax=Stygiolobus caldivivus TaxID=2824673 RepID=A0A8D5U5W8_9CREN|nr:FAD-linked oxidase C-terminal domain-containing protein [Stygiolobus caldivivus]BCU69441.1 FAD-binding oxidoreductase [Stygiolobus caldivivus]
MLLREELSKIVGNEWVISSDEKKLYGFDGLTAVKGEPELVVLPGSEEEVIKVIRLLVSRKRKVIIRGSGTSLSGATVPLNGDEVVVGLSRINKVYRLEGLEIEVGPGIINAMVTKNAPPNLFYAPDPASYQVSSIGGNISHDSGGIHVVKYGPTFNSIIKIKVILPNGAVEDFRPSPLFNPTSIFIGAEGTLGAVLRARLRLFIRPKEKKSVIATFNSLRDAANAIVDIFRHGIVPSALEMMDRYSIIAIEKSRYKAGIPEVEALLLIELDGSQVFEEESKVKSLIASNGGEIINVKDDSKYWNARKGAFPAMGSISPAYITLDCNVLRSNLADTLEKIREIARKYNVYIANVFHAGDGNLHPLISYHPDDFYSFYRAVRASDEIEKMVIENGGVPSGEHGIGIEKVKYIEKYYDADSIEVMRRLKHNFDPEGLFNPCKIFGGCNINSKELKVLWEWD